MSDLFNTLKLYEKLQNTREPASGSVSSIDGKLVDIRCLGHSMILRNVKVNGDVNIGDIELADDIKRKTLIEVIPTISTEIR